MRYQLCNSNEGSERISLRSCCRNGDASHRETGAGIDAVTGGEHSPTISTPLHLPFWEGKKGIQSLQCSDESHYSAQDTADDVAILAKIGCHLGNGKKTQVCSMKLTRTKGQARMLQPTKRTGCKVFSRLGRCVTKSNRLLSRNRTERCREAVSGATGTSERSKLAAESLSTRK